MSLRSYLRDRLAPFIFSNLFNGVVPDDFLTSDARGRLSRRGVPLTEEQTRGIIQEAKSLLSSDLLRALLDEMRAAAQLRVFAAPTNDEALHAKATLYAVEVLSAKIKTLASRPPAPPKRT